MLPNFGYARPRSLREATQLAATNGARIHAGGTDLVGCLRDGVFSAQTVVSLSDLDELRGIRVGADGSVRIGALTTITEVAESAVLREDHAALAEAAAEVASPQLRNQGTLGGNLCQKPRCWYYRGDFPCLRKGGDTCYAYQGDNRGHAIFGAEFCYVVHPSDTAPALVALGAEFLVAGPSGTRRVSAEEFHVTTADDFARETVLEPGEILTEVILPPAPRGRVSSYRKVRTRRSWDFALAGVALSLVLEEGRVSRARFALSGVAAVPWRARAAEQALVGGRLDADLARRAGEAAVDGAEPLEHNVEKVALVRGIVRESLERLA